VSAVPLPRIQVYYPTLDPPDCETKYTVQEAGGCYLRSSPLCAVQNATVANGEFPLVAHDHGGGSAGAALQRISQLSLHETLASHRFVVVSIRHSANAIARVRDLPLVIDFMLGAGNPLSSSIDPERIGISGLSTGGRTSLAVAGGWADPPGDIPAIAADPRIKAMVLYEPGRDNSLEDVSTISFSYLVMGGNRIVNGTGSRSV
jgi:predicted dienelactone hydrolase